MDMSMEQMGYPEQDGADWWQVQEGLEHLERMQWEQEQSFRAFTESLERQFKAEGDQFAAFHATLQAAITALNALLVEIGRA